MIRKQNKKYLDDMTFIDGKMTLYKIVEVFANNRKSMMYKKSYTLGITIKNVKMEDKIEYFKNEIKADHFVYINPTVPLDFETNRFICSYDKKYYELKKVNDSSTSLLLSLIRMEDPDETSFITS